MKTSIVIVDDHAIVREGLRELLSREPDFRVIGEGTNGNDAVHLTRKLEPDVIVMDVSMPDLNGAEATHRIKAQSPPTKIVALSFHADRHNVSRMFCAGASAYVAKSGTIDDLAEAIRRTVRGESYICQAVTDIVIQDYVSQLSSPGQPKPSPLTLREREVLQLLAEGRRSKDIAARLHVSVNTIDTHKRHIMQKSGRHSVAELTKYAIREGLTSLDI